MGYYANVIFIVIFLGIFSYTITKYDYWLNVLVFVIARGLLFSLIFFTSWLVLINNVILVFIVGLVYVKILSVAADHSPHIAFTFLVRNVFRDDNSLNISLYLGWGGILKRRSLWKNF